MVPPSLNFYALTYGMVLAGVVPVLIDPGLGRLQVCWWAVDELPCPYLEVMLASGTVHSRLRFTARFGCF